MPTDLGRWTYPLMVAVLTKGRPDGLQSDAWLAKKTLADFRAGKLTWRG
jgi:hypothetical protein